MLGCGSFPGRGRTGETYKPRRLNVKKEVAFCLGVTTGDSIKVRVQFRGKASYPLPSVRGTTPMSATFRDSRGSRCPEVLCARFFVASPETASQIPGMTRQVPGTTRQVLGTTRQVPGTTRQVLGTARPLAHDRGAGPFPRRLAPSESGFVVALPSIRGPGLWRAAFRP